MEVFIHNLPAQANLSDSGLRFQLKPFMERLRIDDRHYDCAKPTRKSFAFVTFLSQADAERFLSAHGQVQRGPTPVSRLTILGAKVLCKRSDRPANEITLRGLAQLARKDDAGMHQKGTNGRQDVDSRVLRQPQQKQQPQQQPSLQSRAADAVVEEQPASDPTVHFAMRSMKCGYYKFISSKLHFVPEIVEHNQGRVRFGKRHITIERSDDVVIHVPLFTVYEIVWSPNGSLLLTLDTVPIFFSAVDPGQDGRRTRLTALHSRHSAVVGMCLVYQLDVSQENIGRKMQRLHNLGHLTVSLFEVPTASGSDFVRSLGRLRSVLSQATANKSLPFPILIQLHALVFNAYLHPDTVASLAAKLVEIWHKSPVSVTAMKKLTNAIDFPSPTHRDPSEFEVPALLEYLLDTENMLQSGGDFVREGLVNPGRNMTAVYRICVTPTRTTLHGPEFEKQNRVLRKYPSHSDHFIRVQFCDEDGQGLRFSSGIDPTPVYDRFKQILYAGIQVAGRTYSFLGWSHSSLRAHSMWFIAPFVDDQGMLRFSTNIISELGDFANIQTPARCAARIGQAFSETPFTVPMVANNISVLEIPDVKSDDGSRVFSDGVGTVSSEVVSLIWNSMPPGRMFPTCFQVRYAGAKGMLSLDTRLRGRQINIRGSMVKFQSNEKMHLEICDSASRPIPLFLNRQLVKILEDMGVPRSWFLGLQNDAVEELRLVTSSTYNMASYLKTQSVASSIKLHKLFLWADRMNLDYHAEPFLRGVTSAVILRELRLLKDKARMRVPFGITLFGVMDETGYLQEGEVYVTFERRLKSKSQRFNPSPANFISLLVTRSPALHPGDIQKARNIVPPDGHPLRALRNCIVFSSRGQRDLPSQLSGGDLDGDIFNVIWDPDVCLLPNLKTFQAADYPRQELRSIGREVQREDIVDFFIDFIRTDHLGAIATRHIILADQLEHGTLEQKCIAVAEMHSTAVDFSKTGNPADLRKLPAANKFRPDFLAPGPLVRIYDRADIELEDYLDGEDDEQEKLPGLDVPNFKYYRSEKTLGVLYRAIDEKRIWKEHVQTPVQNSTGESASAFFDTFLEWATAECFKFGCQDWKTKEDEALRLRSAYDDTMQGAMYDFSEHATVPLTELEVFIGTIINKTGSQTIRQRDRSRKLHDEFERISAWITSRLRPQKRHTETQKEESEGDTAYGEDDDNNSDEDDDDPDGAWLGKRLESMTLCLACIHGNKAGSDYRFHGRQERYGGSGIQSFWIVAAAALLREIDFVKQARMVDADVQAAELGKMHAALGRAPGIGNGHSPMHGHRMGVQGGVSLVA